MATPRLILLVLIIPLGNNGGVLSQLLGAIINPLFSLFTGT